jgi:hypothetical protein
MAQNPIKVHQALQSIAGAGVTVNRWLGNGLGQAAWAAAQNQKRTYNVNLFSAEEEEQIAADASSRWSKFRNFQTFAGSDIKAVMYLPMLTKASLSGTEATKFKVFADLQTISISSTRSVSPVRVFGRSSPIGYTRGARTFAGSLVFATIRRDPFLDVADASIAESLVNSTTSLIADQLPPFSIVITAVNETGTAATQIIHGITITNYGTTYSIDDLYTETTYTYVATDVQVLSPADLRRGVAPTQQQASAFFSSITDLVESSLSKAYGTVGEITNRIQKDINRYKLGKLFDDPAFADPYYFGKQNPVIGP